MFSRQLQFLGSLTLLVIFIEGQNVQFLSPQTVSRLLSDTKYVEKQLRCVLGKAKCDEIGNQLRIAIPEAIGRNCRACSTEQANNAKKVINFIKSRYPSEFAQIQSKYTHKRG